MTGCAIHVSDLHRGAAVDAAVDAALVALAGELQPQLVLATGDLANRGRASELASAADLLGSLAVPVLAVPGNHDIPYTLPGRLTHPWRAFTAAFGTVGPSFRSPALLAVGLNSVWTSRHQGGRLQDTELERLRRELADAPPGALRLVALHHQLAGSPWRASRKRPLKHRDRVLAELIGAGAEIVVGGHIHQSSAVELRDFTVYDGLRPRTIVLATAPGYGRPRPHRSGEAQGLHVYRWDRERIVVETRVWDGADFVTTAERIFPRRGAEPPR